MEHLKSLEEFINESLESNTEAIEVANQDEVMNEEDGGGGAAVATAGTTAGMGNVASAQPASTPGAASTGDGTTGSGDYGNPLFPTAKQDGSNTVGKKKKKNKDKDKNKRKNKKESTIQDFIARYKEGKSKGEGGDTKSSEGSSKSKMLSFDDFVSNDIKK